MTTKRLPRLKRAGDNKPPFRLQPRDIEIIKHVHDYRFLLSDQIQHLVSGSSQTVSKRLQKLFHHGYLDRLNTSVCEKFVYALGNTGADILNLRGYIDRGKIDWVKKNNEVGMSYNLHTLMVANFRIILNLALSNNPDTELVLWVPEGEKLRDKVVIRDDDNKGIKFPFYPDAYFILKSKGKYLNFFLEADRSTMDHERFKKKMKAYWQFYKQGKHVSKFNIDSFRVLTVTISKDRQENLRKVTKEADDNKSGSGMFWFACEKDYDFDNPKSILGNIWQTPKNDDVHNLLE